MSEIKVDFSSKSLEYTDEEISFIKDVLRNTNTYTQGKYLSEFEQKFSEYIGCKNSFAVSNCTAALELAAILCRLQKDDEVIIPAHTFCATAIPFARYAKIVWADINPETLVVDPESIKKLITNKTKVIVAVHLYGLMAPMKEIRKIADENNLLLVEDCAQSIGASIDGIKCGNFGDFACFSFHTHKNLTTFGEGGMIVVKDDELAKKIPGLRHNGLRGFDPNRKQYWVPAMSNVDFDFDGFWPYNFCITEIQCAIGVKLLDRIDSINADRNARGKRFIEEMSDYPELIFQKIPHGYYSAYHLLPARYDGSKYGKNNSDLIEKLYAKYGIKTVVQYYPLNRYPMFVKAGYGKADCPNTDYFFDNMLSFPFHHCLSEDDFNYMIKSTKMALEELRK